MNMNQSSSTPFNDLSGNEKLDTTALRINQKLSSTNFKNVTQSDSSVEVTQTRIIDSNKPSTSAFVDITGDITPPMTTLGSSSIFLSDAEMDKSNLFEINGSSTQVCIDWSVNCQTSNAASRIIRNKNYEPNISYQNNYTIPEVTHEQPDRAIISLPDNSLPQSSNFVVEVLPLLSSTITHDYSDPMDVQMSNNNIRTIFNDTTLVIPKLSLRKNHATLEPSMIMSWTLNTNDLIDTIEAYEIFCYGHPETNDDNPNEWEHVGLVNTHLGTMSCIVHGIGVKGKTYEFIIRAKYLQDLNVPFSYAVPFTFL